MTLLRAPESGRRASGALVTFARAIGWTNRLLSAAAMIALLAAAAVLTSSVFTRYILKWPTEWQDETSVFLLVGSTFVCGAWVQAARGHVAIEAVSGLLPERANRVRQKLVDIVSALFCGFFAWKSWALLREALADHQTTDSSWGPPLWIPYLAMSVGMTLLVLQLVLQIAGAAETAPQKR